MSKFKDRSLQCADCGRTYTFTSGEQEFYQERGYSEPRRCPDCRAARKTSRPGGERPTGRRPAGDSWGNTGGDRPPREMFDVICASCGKPTQVPFKPRNDRPVYCKDCYDKQRG